MKHIFLFLGVLMGPLVLSAQKPADDGKRLDLSIAYYGNNVWNPGMKTGMEYIWKEWLKIKEKHETTATKTNRLIFHGDAGLYWDPMNYTALFLYSGLRFRHLNPKGFHYYFGASPAAVYRSFLTETYEVSSEGEVSGVSCPGRTYYAPTLTCGIGMEHPEMQKKGWFIGMDIMFLTHYNADFVPLMNYVFGYRFSL
jgi:hypothetical protein